MHDELEPDSNFDPVIELTNLTSSFVNQTKDNRLNTSVNNAISLVHIENEEDRTQNQPID